MNSEEIDNTRAKQPGSGMATTSLVIVNGRAHGEFISNEYGHLFLHLPRPSGRDDLLVRPTETSANKKDDK